MSTPLLEVEDLTVGIGLGRDVWKTVVDAVTFTVEQGGSVGLVGESGSGKTLTLRAIINQLPPRARVLRGRVALNGVDLTGMSGRRRLQHTQGRISIVLQEPLSALNPLMRVGEQLAEAPRRKYGLSRSDSRDRAVELLKQVDIPDPERRARAYPHELSGGQRQRVMIAMAVACEPTLILCDEPTASIDATLQVQILSLLRRVYRESDAGLLMVSHDLAVVSQVSEMIAVMYSGQILETGRATDVLTYPRHGYTAQLLQASPGVGDTAASLQGIPGSLPDPMNLPSGCRFSPRCAHEQNECRVGSLPLQTLDRGRETRCVRHVAVATDWERNVDERFGQDRGTAPGMTSDSL